MRPYNVTVAGDGVPFLLINGGFHTRNSFSQLGAALGENFQIITFDFPNQAPDTFEPNLLKIKDYADITAAALEQAGVRAEETVVFGLSSGGNVARYMHCCQGVNFKVLYLAGANPGGMENFYGRLHREYIDGIRKGGIVNFSRMAMFVFFSQLYHCKEPALGDQIHQRLEMAFGSNVDGLITLIESVFHDETFQLPPADFRCPTFIMRGTEDFLVPKLMFDKYIGRCTAPVLESFEIPGGHAFPMENVAATEQIITATAEELGLELSDVVIVNG